MASGWLSLAQDSSHTVNICYLGRFQQLQPSSPASLRCSQAQLFLRLNWRWCLDDATHSSAFTPNGEQRGQQIRQSHLRGSSRIPGVMVSGIWAPLFAEDHVPTKAGKKLTFPIFFARLKVLLSVGVGSWQAPFAKNWRIRKNS